MVAGLMVAATGIDNSAGAWLLWPVYWFAQGTMFWAIFVLGHDCGHGSFSDHKRLNSTVGNLLHSFLLVPYWPWALSHRHHHKNTGHIDRDEPFAPHRRHPRKVGRIWGVIERGLILLFGTAWFGYLAFYSRALSSHLNPFDRMFRLRRRSVWISLGCLATAFAIVSACIQTWGWLTVTKLYLAPLFVFASWLVVTTFLHHNHPAARWYSGSDWTFVRGNLSTIDRSYGVFDWIVHDIGTHQVHHLFPSIPHYHLREATEAFRRAFPDLVQCPDEGIILPYFRHLWAYSRRGTVASGQTVFSYADEADHQAEVSRIHKTKT